MPEGLLARLKANIVASTPEVDLDFPGYRVQHTAEGLLVDVDPVAFRRGARKASVLIAIAFALLLPIPFTAVRVVGALGIVGAFVLAFVGKPRPDKVLLTPQRATAAVKGRPPRDVPVSAIEQVRLDREETERHDNDGTHTHVTWEVRLVLAEGPWHVARSVDREKARAFAEDAAVALGRPFLDATAEGGAPVPADAVGLSFVERVRTGLIAASDPGTPPAGVEVRVTASGREFVARRRAWKRALALGVFGGWFVLLGLGGAVLLVAVAFAPNGSPWALGFVVFPLLFAGVGVAGIWGGVASVTGDSVVRVQRDGVAYGVRRGGKEKMRVVAFSAFEDVRVRGDVRLVGDDDETALGFSHLTPAAQAWLAAALKREIAR